MISWTVSDHEQSTIQAIAERAESKLHTDYVRTMMDITAAHANGNPLRLVDLLIADDYNFSHDVLGIARHIDRDTGALGGYFTPRFTVREVAA